MFKKAHGIEVLLRKASVDSEFRRLLLTERAAAAEEISLELTPAEESILASVPEADLVRMIDKIEVPEAHRTAFMGKTAAVMLAIVVGAGLIVTCSTVLTTGIRPDEGFDGDQPQDSEPDDDENEPTRGIRPDPVEPKEETGDGK